MKVLILIAALILPACGGDNETVNCDLKDHAKQYTVTYEKVNGDCGELAPSLAYTPLLNVADCNVVTENYKSCTYSFMMKCVDGANTHMAEFSSTKQNDNLMTGTAKFSGYPCTGEYKTTLTPVK